MAEPIRIAKGILVPEGGIEWRAVRSSGPGGQNVNKVASKVELRVRLDSVSGLSAPARARLAALAAGRLDADGRLLVTSQRTRDQLRNLEDARDKVKKLVERALEGPAPAAADAAGPRGRRAAAEGEARAQRGEARPQGRARRRVGPGARPGKAKSPEPLGSGLRGLTGVARPW